MNTNLFLQGKSEILRSFIKESNIKAFLVSKEYIPDYINHSVISDIPRNQRFGNKGDSDIINAVKLEGLDVKNAILIAKDVNFQLVTANLHIKYLILFKDTGKEENSPLIGVLTTEEGKGFPLITNGGDITIGWDKRLGGIFKL